MVAPIALYPDELLTQICIAATYPLEVVEAQRWVGKNPNLKGAGQRPGGGGHRIVHETRRAAGKARERRRQRPCSR